MKIAVVDDDIADREKLQGDIEKYAAAHDLLLDVTLYANGEDFLARVKLADLDVVFLDIYMGELNGLDVAYKIRSLNRICQIIFVTRSASFAVQSYDVQAFYYLVKPYTTANIEKVLALLVASQQKKARFLKIKEGRDWRKVPLDSLLYADYRNHYVQLHLQDEIIITYMKFSEIAGMLQPYAEFLVCYRCLIVNLDKIIKAENNFFLLANGEYIPINRSRTKEIKAQYADYIFGTMEFAQSTAPLGKDTP